MLDVKFENIVGEVSRLTLKEERDVDMVKKRAEELADWIKNDTQKLFEQMAKVDRTALDCENKVKTYTLMVNELQASEDRNDEFMKKLLGKAESLELHKVDRKAYKEDQQGLLNRLEQFDRYNKENHVHYVQIENYLDKYLRLKVQQQIGKSIASAFENKKSILERYKQYEEGFLKEANKAILADEG